MKNSVFLLIIILLSPMFLSTINLSSAFLQTGSDVTLNVEPNVEYTYTGNLGINELDYWRVSANAGETLTIGIDCNAGSAPGWTSTLYFSNGTVAQSIPLTYNAHSHIFPVTKTDNYVLLLSSLNNNFNYTIESSRQMIFANAFEVTGVMSTNELNYWKFYANAGDLVLIGVDCNAGSAPGWTSSLYYSNTTVFQSISLTTNAHNHMFVAPYSGLYLMVLSSLTNGFNYTVVSSHQMIVATPFKETGVMSTNELNYWKFYANAGDLVLIGVDCNAGSAPGWTSSLYYSNTTVFQSISLTTNAHNHMFVAPYSGLYLMVLSSLTNGFNYTVVSSHQMIVATPFKETGVMSTNELNYWKFYANAGDLVLIGVDCNAGSAPGWTSSLYYSNTTVFQSISLTTNAHNHMFVAPYSGLYLMVLSSLTNGFNYTVVSSHQMIVATPFKETGVMSTNELNYWKFYANAGDLVLIGVDCNAGSAPGWTSSLYYSNTTVFQSISLTTNAHNHMFVAPYSGLYLMVLSSLTNGFNYTVVSSHQMIVATPFKETGAMSTNDIDHLSFNNVKKGDVLLIGIDCNAGSAPGWTLFCISPMELWLNLFRLLLMLTIIFSQCQKTITTF